MCETARRPVARRHARRMHASELVAATGLALITLVTLISSTIPDSSWCEVAARTQSGWVCGLRKRASSGAEYASFRGVPYAKQPLGELRFQELLPPEPWQGFLNATKEGPICPQTDVFYGRVMVASGGMAEGCIHANVHVPIAALPASTVKGAEGPDTTTSNVDTGLPILVFIHGGGFAFGSGDSDLHGPEYLVSKNVIVITFNYRLNVFGFLSLNSTSIPGNNGLRDAISLLCWVRANARAFGGNPDLITVAGQSAGAAMTHLLTLSPAASGLFNKAIVMSGTGFSDFFSTSPVFAKTISDMFLTKMGIPLTLPPDEIHQLLVKAPIETIMAANKDLLNMFGLTTFVPVVESPQPGVTAILDDDPEVLEDSGRGSEIVTLIGFTDVECETFRPRLEEIDIVAKIQAIPSLVVPARILYQTPPATVPLLTKLIHNKYFNYTIDMDSFVNLCTDGYYKYAALKLAEKIAQSKTRSFLYRFSYGGYHSSLKKAFRLKFPGAGHVEDLTYVFRTNSILGPLNVDELSQPDSDSIIKNEMTDIFVNFMRYGYPINALLNTWPPQGSTTQYQNIASPHDQQLLSPTAEESTMKEFFDSLYKISRGG